MKLELWSITALYSANTNWGVISSYCSLDRGSDRLGISYVSLISLIICKSWALELIEGSFLYDFF